MGLENVITGITQIKEANTRRGNQFRQWVKQNFKLTGTEEFQYSEKGMQVLGISEVATIDFCNQVLRAALSKSPDIVAKAGKTFLTGEAKFLSPSGSNQSRAFEDGINTATDTHGHAVKVFILDGIHWIERNSEQYKRISNATAPIFSVLLLEEFLHQLENASLST